MCAFQYHTEADPFQGVWSVMPMHHNPSSPCPHWCGGVLPA